MPALVPLLLVLLATAPCRYGTHACDDYSKPMAFGGEIDFATAPPTVKTRLWCPGDGSLHTLNGPPDDPAVLAWRCPASTFPSLPRHRAVSTHVRVTKD